MEPQADEFGRRLTEAERKRKAIPEGYIPFEEARDDLRRQVRSDAGCPDEAVLCGYVDGSLQQHLEECPLCSADVQHLREEIASDAPPQTLQPAPRRRLEKVLSLAAQFLMAALSLRFLCGVLVTFVVAGMTYAVVSVSPELDMAAFFKAFVKDAEGVKIVIPNNRVRLPVEGKVVEVSDRIGTGDAKAIGMLYHILWMRGAQPGAIRVLTSEEVNDAVKRGGPPPAGALCIIGGPGASDLALEYMARLRGVADPRDPDALKRGFRFRVLPEGGRNAFSQPVGHQADGDLPQLGIVDAESPADLCPVGPQERAGAFDPDAALVMRGDDLDGRPVLIIAGYETAGTLGAMKALSRPGKIVSEFQKVYERHGYAEMVIRTKPGTGEPELFQFPTVQNPRGR